MTQKRCFWLAFRGPFSISPPSPIVIWCPHLSLWWWIWILSCRQSLWFCVYTIASGMLVVQEGESSLLSIHTDDYEEVIHPVSSSCHVSSLCFQDTSCHTGSCSLSPASFAGWSCMIMICSFLHHLELSLETLYTHCQGTHAKVTGSPVQPPRELISACWKQMGTAI